MSNTIKLVGYRTARALGLFRLARWLTRHHVRILAYHGFATSDEARFRSKLFITVPTFASRLEALDRLGYHVITLDDAVGDLIGRAVRPDSVVITIDDGYASTLHRAAPLLHARGMPATVYLTTYHVRTQTPVFDLIVAYLLWKSERPQVVLAWPPGGPARQLDLSTSVARERVADDLVTLGRSLSSEGERVALCRRLAEAVGVDYDEVVARGAFRLMSAAEAKALSARGVQIALHTHRHRFPPGDLVVCAQEIADNREFLQREVGAFTEHFCYPSGVYDPVQWPVLMAAGVRSATTCDTGLACSGDPALGLRRFLDGESVAPIEFEAELSGFASLLRRLVGRPG